MFNREVHYRVGVVVTLLRTRISDLMQSVLIYRENIVFTLTITLPKVLIYMGFIICVRGDNFVSEIASYHV